MINKDFKIAGMSCGHCIIAIKKELSKLNIQSSEIEIGSANIMFDETKVTEQQIEAAISEAGYEIIK